MSNIKRSLRQILPPGLGDLLSKIYGKWVIKKWKKNGAKAPAPNHFKQQIISEIQRETNCKYFIETGTFQGDMIYAQRKNFQHLYSIELDPELHKKACHRFRKDQNIDIHLGDSAKVLGQLPQEESRLYWLDAHYSGGVTAKGNLDCPIYQEIDQIDFEKSKTVLMIDDARCFDGTNDYPKLVDLENYMSGKTSRHSFYVAHDIIHIIPKD